MKTKQKEFTSLVISKTLIFIVVVLLVSTFKSIFGDENSLIGVTSVVLMLVMMQIDLTLNPFKNLIILILLNLILGLSAFWVSQNLILGLVLNFTIMSFIGYYFSYELKKPINMMIGLHYILMIVNPILVSQLPVRLSSLVAGSFMIMFVQLISNKNKLIKSRKKMIESILESMLIKIELLKLEKSTNEVDSIITTNINQLKSTVFNSGKNDTHLTELGKNTINILSCLDKINRLLDEIELSSIDIEFLDEIYNIVSNIKSENFNIDICDLKSKYEKINTNFLDNESMIRIFDFINALEMLTKEIKKYYFIKNEPKDIPHELSLPNEFKNLHVQKNLIRIDSTRVAYGIRLGLVVAITFLIVDLFNIEFGEWAIYTVFALSQPHSEYTIYKCKKRIIGTIIGAIIISLLFNLISDPSLRTLILVASGYIMSYMSDYRDLVIFVTISAIASASIYIVNPNLIILNRLIFIVIGIFISLIANKLILPRKLSDEVGNLINMNVQSLSKMVDEVLFNKESVNTSMVGLLYLVPTLIDLRVDYLKQNGLEMDKSLIYKNEVLMNDIYQIYLLGKYDSYCNNSFVELRTLLNSNYSIHSIKNNFLNTMSIPNETNDMNKKYILLKLINILDTINDLHYNEECQTDLYQFLSVFN